MDSRIPHNRPSLGKAEAHAAARVISSGFVAPGPEVAAFEAELAAYLSVDPSQVVLVSSGSAALLLAMRSLPRAVQRVQLPVYGCSAPLDAAEMAHLEWDLVVLPIPTSMGRTSSRFDVDFASRVLARGACRERGSSHFRGLFRVAGRSSRRLRDRRAR